MVGGDGRQAVGCSLGPGARSLPTLALAACIGFASLRGLACAAPPDEVGASSVSWTLPALLAQLRQNNPQLEQAHQGYLAAQLQVPQARSLPAPQVSFAEQANTGGRFDFNPSSGFYAYPTLTQPLLWPGKRGLAGDAASAQAAVVGRQYDSLLLQLTAQVQLDYYQLVALQSQLRFMREDQQRLEQIKSLAQVRYANNAAAYVEFLNAQVSVSSLENDRYALEKQIQALKEQLNLLIARPPESDLHVPEVDATPHLPAQTLPALLDLARANNPAVAASQSQVDAADKSLALAQKSVRPDFALSVGAYTDPWLDHLGSTRIYTIGVTMNLPSWGLTREHAAVGQARAILAQARSAQSAQHQQLEVNVASAYHALESALHQLSFTRERLLPQAQAAYRLALSGYASHGATNFTDLLTAQSALRSTELALVQAQSSAVQASVNLTAAIGREAD